MWIADQKAHFENLPKKIQEILIYHQKNGSTDSQEYADASLEYYQRHMCRLNPWPEEIEQCQQGANLEIYELMWGPSEFFATGTLKDYDVSAQLHKIKVPTLFTCGRFDPSTPASNQRFCSQIPGAKLKIFEQSSHTPQLEEREEYLDTIDTFLINLEKTRTSLIHNLEPVS